MSLRLKLRNHENQHAESVVCAVLNLLFRYTDGLALLIFLLVWYVNSSLFVPFASKVKDLAYNSLIAQAAPAAADPPLDSS